MASNAGSSLIAGVRQQIEALPPRSRVMLAVLLILLGITRMGGLWWWTSSSLATQAEALQTEQKMLKLVQLKQVQYRQAEELIQRAETRLGKGTQNPSTTIEQAATQIGVREMLRGIEKLGAETRGNLKETRYRVTLSRAPIQGTMQLVHDIETAGFMSAETIEYKSAFVRGERTLNATIDLIAYELVKKE